jgi:hypothetical protein
MEHNLASKDKRKFGVPKYTKKVMNPRCNNVSVTSREDKSICIFVGPC